MERTHPTPRTPRRLLLATVVAALAAPTLGAATMPQSAPSATDPAPATPAGIATTEGTVDVRGDLDLDALPFLDAAGEYDPVGDATITVDPLTPEPVVMGEGHGHGGSHDHGLEVQSSGEQEGQDDTHDDAADTVAGAGGGSLPSTRRPLLCAPTGDHRTVVLYAHLRGQPQARSEHLGTIRVTMERSNQMLSGAT